MKKALVTVAPGFEEIEAITSIDVLRRADWSVVVGGTMPGIITASRKTKHLPDKDISDVLEETFDVIVLPGGAEGTANLSRDARVKALLERQVEEDRWVAAICAAPQLLVWHKLCPERKITAHPTCRKDIPQDRLIEGPRVVVDGKVITSVGAGTALEFALAILYCLEGSEVVQRVAQGLCARFDPSEIHLVTQKQEAAK
ncbi:DJ-1 family glyoxalase III [Candidatus Methylacidithermus pantelleriae]|uniref:Intracellular protease/amidase n=1 Tax=Candidatus Methylacidithermus pantelleriae TaxID=2744239 RepID=A0A8J2FWR7_9BACT|nr:DJ-1 family glyoxalase III [Candidatus Methylacidithermus pantelleriae]CAF0700841.1 Putative intracellular protease/amidase [Candidatus Methylacidithermus pantelleriae]